MYLFLHSWIQRGAGGLDPLPDKSQNIVFLSKTDPNPIKIQASVQCLIIIVPLVKHRLIGGSLEGR